MLGKNGELLNVTAGGMYMNGFAKQRINKRNLRLSVKTKMYEHNDPDVI